MGFTNTTFYLFSVGYCIVFNNFRLLCYKVSSKVHTIVYQKLSLEKWFGGLLFSVHSDSFTQKLTWPLFTSRYVRMQKYILVNSGFGSYFLKFTRNGLFRKVFSGTCNVKSVDVNIYAIQLGLCLYYKLHNEIRFPLFQNFT